MVESITGIQYFPVELVERIIEYLPPHSRAILLRTGKALSRPSFWHSLYHSVLLQDKHQLDTFLHTVRTSSLGQYVRQVTLTTGLAQQKGTMTELQCACPNVAAVQLTQEPCNRTLNYRCDLTRWTHIVSASDDIYCNINDIIRSTCAQLLHLSIKTPLPTVITLPLLTHLDYHVDTLDLETLNQINQSCPSLKTLSLKYLNIPWDERDCLNMQKWTASRTLVYLEMEHVYFADPKWYSLLHRLYPNLRSLILHSLASSSQTMLTYNTFDFDDDTLPAQYIDYRHHYTWETTLQALTHLMNGLTCLKRLHIYTIGATPSPTDDDQEWLALFQSLNDLRLDWYCRPFKTYGGLMEKPCDPKWLRVQTLMKACSNNIPALHLFLKQDPLPLQQQTLLTMPTLTSLILHTTYQNDRALPIDILLTLLPHLTTLEFRLTFDKELLASPIEKQAPRSTRSAQSVATHGLIRFVYIGKLTTARLVAYVHARCPRLKVLHLDARQVPPQKPIRLDLTGWHLEELDLGSSCTFGKMHRSVLVKDRMDSRWFLFGNGAWERCRRDLGVANLTIICDSIDLCVFKPQPPSLDLIV